MLKFRIRARIVGSIINSGRRQARAAPEETTSKLKSREVESFGNSQKKKKVVLNRAKKDLKNF